MLYMRSDTMHFP